MQHTRAKLPEGLAPSEGDPHITPWHQDAGAFDVDADPHFGPHVWLPPSEARPENGCLQIVPHAHHEGLQEHRIERPSDDGCRRRAVPRGRTDRADGQGGCALVSVVVHAGLRSGEIYRLQWRDIDWETGELTVASRRGEHTKN